jgi:hypothetical protein
MKEAANWGGLSVYLPCHNKSDGDKGQRNQHPALTRCNAEYGNFRDKPVRHFLPLPNISRATAAMSLWIAEAPSTAAADEVARGYVGQCDVWQFRCDTGCRQCPRFRLLKGPGGLAIRPSCGCERHYQHQEADTAH